MNTPMTGDDRRKLLHAMVVDILNASGIPFLEVWDYDLTTFTVSVLLDKKTKARYYARLMYLAVYEYTDETLTHVERFYSYRADPHDISKLKRFDPYVKELNEVILLAQTQLVQRHLGLPMHPPPPPARVLFLHSLPPYTEDESVFLLNQADATQASVSNPIRFTDQLYTVVVFDGTVYIARIALFSYIHPRSIITATGTESQVRTAAFKRTVVCPLHGIDYMGKGTNFLARTARRATRNRDVAALSARAVKNTTERNSKPHNQPRQRNREQRNGDSDGEQDRDSRNKRRTTEDC